MKSLQKPEIKIIFIYLVISLSWIIFSDKLVLLLIKVNPESLTTIQTWKGIAFNVIVGCVIYFLVKESAQKLRQTESDHNELFAKNPTPMWIYEVDSLRILRVNKAAIAHYGYTNEEFSDLTILDLRPVEDVPFVRAKLSELTDHSFSVGIWRHRKKSGEIFSVQVTTHNLKFQNKNCRLVTAHDATEKLSLEQKLFETSHELKILINSITDGFAILSKDFTILKSNKKLQEMANLGTGNLAGTEFSKLFPENGTFGYEKYNEAISTNKSVHFEECYSPGNTWFRISAYPFEHGLLVFLRDITQEKKHEKKLVENELKLNALINNTEDLIWSVDNEFRYFTYNHAYEVNYRYLFQQDIYVGKLALNEQHGAEHISLWKRLYQRSLKGEKFSYDMDIVLSSGVCKTTNINFNPIYNDEKKIIGVGCFLHDITQRRKYERRVEEQNNKLRKIAIFTSHSVRAPLANLLGLTEALNLENCTDPDNLKVLEYIKASAQRLDTVVKDIVMQTAEIENEQVG